MIFVPREKGKRDTCEEAKGGCSVVRVAGTLHNDTRHYTGIARRYINITVYV
jgi:hypothetical protein